MTFTAPSTPSKADMPGLPPPAMIATPKTKSSLLGSTPISKVCTDVASFYATTPQSTKPPTSSATPPSCSKYYNYNSPMSDVGDVVMVNNTITIVIIYA